MGLADVKIGIIGAGSMGAAIASGLMASKACAAERVLLAGHHLERVQGLAENAIRLFADDAKMLAEGPDVVILAVKPQVLPDVMAQYADALAGRLVISIAAGVKISAIEAALPGARVVRAMPNLCVKLLSGASAVAGGPTATEADVELARELFGALGAAFVMREDQLEVEGAVVGTAPAFFALFVDTLTRAGVKAGLPAAACRELLEATMAGVGRDLRTSGEHPRSYMEKVTSPGGTTACGLFELEPHLLEGSYAAVEAALARSAELAEN